MPSRLKIGLIGRYRLLVPGSQGASALREAFAGRAPTVPQRHIVTNTLVTDWDGGSAQAISDVSSASAASPAGR